jgi:hypothetical protein
LRNPRVDWGKACEFSVDFDNEVAISQIGVKDKEVVQECAVEMGPRARIHIPSFKEIGIVVKKLIGGGNAQTHTERRSHEP